MKKNLLATAKLLFFLGLGLFLVWWIYKGLTPEQVANCKAAFLSIRIPILVALLFIGLMGHLFRALRWQIMIEPLGHAPKLSNVFGAVMIGYMANLAFPRLGEVSKCAVINKYEKIPLDKLIGTIIAERAVDVICLLLFVFFTIIAQTALLYGFFNTHVTLPLKAKIANVNVTQLILLLLGILIFVVIIGMLFKKFKTTVVFKKLLAVLNSVWQGASGIFRMKNKGLFLLYTAGIWVSYLGLSYVAFFAIEQTSNLGIGAALSSLTFGSFGVIATQGGIGAYHIIIQKLLTLYNISEDYGFAYAWITWGIQFFVMVLGGLAALIILPIINKTKTNA
jgi:uncharacterized protein (TIRG00374 family)